MGYLTTFTIYNDALDQIREHPDEFVEGILKGAHGGYHDRYAFIRGNFGVGNHCNCVEVQKPRHADDHTVYVHMGNTLCEMNEFSSDTERLMKQSPKFFKEMLDYMELQVKMLKRKAKEYEQRQDSEA